MTSLCRFGVPLSPLWLVYLGTSFPLSRHRAKKNWPAKVAERLGSKHGAPTGLNVTQNRQRRRKQVWACFCGWARLNGSDPGRSMLFCHTVRKQKPSKKPASSSLAFHWYFDDFCGLKCKADTTFELAFHWEICKRNDLGMTSWKRRLDGPKGSDQS